MDRKAVRLCCLEVCVMASENNGSRGRGTTKYGCQEFLEDTRYRY
jgi:hypothetical protein